MSIVAIFQLLEELVPVVARAGSVSAAVSHLDADVDWTLFWATHLFLAVFMVLYALITALIDVIGRERLLELMFVDRRASEATTATPG
jgi:hypothetical protein